MARVIDKRAALIALAALFAASALTATSASASFPGNPGVIAFDSQGAIKTIGPLGGGIALLGDGVDPAFSPNGELIALATNGRKLIVMRSYGSSPRTVYAGTSSVSEPCFSADGKTIFFTHDTSGEGYADIWSIPTAGGSPTRLTATGTANSEIDSKDPQASANGRFVIFERNGWIWTMRPNGSHPKKLARGSAASISPTSRRVVIARREHLVLIGAAGGGERILNPITFKKQPEELTRGVAWPAFSPDGRSVAFTLKRTTSFGPGLNQSNRLAVYSLATRRTRILTNPEISARHADWQPLR